MASPGAFIEFSACAALRRMGVASLSLMRLMARVGARVWGWSCSSVSQARRKGDRVLALIRGSAVNQDGASNGVDGP